MYDFSKAFSPKPFQAFPPTPEAPSQSDFNLMFLRANDAEYQNKDFRETQPGGGDLSQNNYHVFQQEIESHFDRRRESVRRNATDQSQDYACNLSTPRLSSTTSTSEEPELWSIWQEQKTSVITTTTADVLPEHESQADIARPLAEDGPLRVIQRRQRKRKTRSEAEIKAARDASLLRNRGAASKCRAKKKDWIKELEDDARVGKLQNDELRLERDELMAEVDMLKNLVSLCQAEDTRPVKDGEQAQGFDETSPAYNAVEEWLT